MEVALNIFNGGIYGISAQKDATKIDKKICYSSVF